MRIGLISDTHIPGGATEVPSNVVKAFNGVDLILHAGNIYTSPVLDWLERIAPVKAAGSADRDRQCHGDPRVAEMQVLEVEGHTIGVTHDLMVPGFGGYVYPGSLANQFHHDGPRDCSLGTLWLLSILRSRQLIYRWFKLRLTARGWRRA